LNNCTARCTAIACRIYEQIRSTDGIASRKLPDATRKPRVDAIVISRVALGETRICGLSNRVTSALDSKGKYSIMHPWKELTY
jgi:hypothetical protein